MASQPNLKIYRFKNNYQKHAYTEDCWTTLGHHWYVGEYCGELDIWFIKQDSPGKYKRFKQTSENLPRAIKAQLFLMGVQI